MKMIGDRRRPDRDGLGVPQRRWVTMPSSTSFPSGHSASAAAFATAVGDLVPTLKTPLRGAASVVAFSRVYTGVHYPSDVLVGATVGAVLGRAASAVARRRRRPTTGVRVTQVGWSVLPRLLSARKQGPIRRRKLRRRTVGFMHLE
jgi:membrane-associated phospholipid phosphatase